MKNLIWVGGAVVLASSCVVTFPEDYALRSTSGTGGVTSSTSVGGGGAASGSSSSTASSSSSSSSSSASSASSSGLGGSAGAGGAGGSTGSSSGLGGEGGSTSSSASSSGAGGAGGSASSSSSSSSASSSGAVCGNGLKDGAETDLDCGGGACPPCAFDKLCGSGSDCVSQSCIGGHCAATCTDNEKNGTESDVDCGGSCGSNCTSGKSCGGNGDCASNKCSGNKCVDVLLISEVQTRGTNASSDEFIEIYNPNAYPVTFDTTWEVWTRNAASNACAVLNKRITGGNQVIPSHAHLLFTNASAMGYNGAVVGDATYTTGFSDSGQIVLLRSGALVDSLCYYFSASTQANLTCATPPAMWFACQGAVSNSPHNDTTGGAGNTDVSMERKPGGILGHGQNTGDNTTDFTGNMTATPQNLASPSTP